MSDDLSEATLAACMDRPFRTYPALLSTDADAIAWARAGAPAGAVVVADYQVAARGRGGLPWDVRPGRDLGFSLVLRPRLAPEREGWLYTVATSALADVLGEQATIEWPDEIQRARAMAAAVGIEVRLGGPTIKWAVVNVLIRDAEPPRGPLLGSVLQAIDARLAAAPAAVLADYVPLCRTIGRDVRVRLLGGATRLQGRALEVLEDGALVIEAEGGRRVPVRPQDISSIEGV
ncbi:MAG: hypothetical protein KY463_16225 [Actinobacteria bacterium]|nr:hypothetical protein [Actinomycetota bacterium]